MPSAAPHTDPRQRDTDMAIAVFRTIFILIVLFSPQFTQARAGGGRLFVVAVIAAATYNLVLFLVHQFRQLSLSRWLIIVGDLVLISLWIHLCGEGRQAFFGLYYAVVIGAAMWFRIWGALLSAVSASVLYLWVIALSAPSTAVWQTISGPPLLQVVILLGVAGLVTLMADRLRRESAESARRHATILEYRERIRIFQRVDDLVRPRRLATLPGFDIAFRFRPSFHAAGAGDYYDVIRLGPRRLGVCMGDISGSREMTTPYLPVFKAEFRAAARRESSPARVLAEMNRWVMAEMEERGNRDAFIAMCYVIIDLDEGKLTYAIAGHEPPLLLTHTSDAPVVLEKAGIVLGVLPQVTYQQETVPVHTADTLVLFTDGMTEVSDERNRFLGREGLCAHILAHASLPHAKEIADRVFNAANDYGKHGRRRDDMTLLVVRITAADVGAAGQGRSRADFAPPD